MSVTHLTRFVKQLWTKPAPRRTVRPVLPTRRLYLEILESRALLSGGPGGHAAVLVASPLQGSSPGGPALVSGSSTPNGGGSTPGGPSAGLVTSISGSPGGPSGGSSSTFMSGPGYPLAPATGPALQGSLVTS